MPSVREKLREGEREIWKKKNVTMDLMEAFSEQLCK